MKYLFMAALFLAVASPAFAEGKDKGPTPQQLHDEFVGYAQEYYDEAKELSYKAAKTDDAHKADLFRQLADINHQLAGQKERMAVGFLNNDEEAVDHAEDVYHELRVEEKELWKAINGE